MESSALVPMVVTVPPGVAPGQMLVVQAPDGQKAQVTVPPGVMPGQQMAVQMPVQVPAMAIASVDDGTGPGLDGIDGPKKRWRKSGGSVPRWTAEEEERLREAVTELGDKAWGQVADRLGSTRSPSGAGPMLKWAVAGSALPPRAAPYGRTWGGGGARGLAR